MLRRLESFADHFERMAGYFIKRTGGLIVFLSLKLSTEKAKLIEKLLQTS